MADTMTAPETEVTETEASAVPATTRADVLASLEFRVQKELRYRAVRKSFYASIADGSVDDDAFGQLLRAALFASDEVDRARADFELTLHSHIIEGLL